LESGRNRDDGGQLHAETGKARALQENEGRMIWAAIALLFLAALLHSWYGGNYRAKSPGDVSMAFILYQNHVVSVGIVLLLAGLVLLWFAKGFLWVIAGAIVYWFVLPMVTVPLLVALKVVPPYTLPWRGRDA
jgi:hypothetical protein